MNLFFISVYVYSNPTYGLIIIFRVENFLSTAGSFSTPTAVGEWPKFIDDDRF